MRDAALGTRDPREREEVFKRFGYDIQKERNFILENAEPFSGDLLEIGTGKGHFTHALALKGYRVVSVDISEETQAVARRFLQEEGLGDAVDFRVEDAERLSFPNGHFDTIFSINTFHHLDHPQRVAKEMVRLLRVTGKIVISDFTKEGFEIIDAIHQAEGRGHHPWKEVLFGPRAYLVDNGFTVNETRSKFQHILIACR